MNRTTLYRVSLGFTVLLTLAAFFLLLAGIGTLIRGWGEEPWLALLPWKPLAAVAVAGLNCTVRKRVIRRS